MRDYWPIAERTFGVVSLGALFLSDGTLLYRSCIGISCRSSAIRVPWYRINCMQSERNVARTRHSNTQNFGYYILVHTYMGCKKIIALAHRSNHFLRRDMCKGGKGFLGASQLSIVRAVQLMKDEISIRCSLFSICRHIHGRRIGIPFL